MSKSASSPAGLRRPARRPEGHRQEDPLGGHRHRAGDPLRPARPSPGISNLLTIYSALTDRKIAELEGDYAGRGYGDLKKDLAEVVVEFTAPLRERVRGYLDDPAELDRVLAGGAARAREVAGATLRRVTTGSGSCRRRG